MNRLKEFEDIVVDVVRWSTSLIHDIFIIEPDAHSVKNVAAFMYDNGIPF